MNRARASHPSQRSHGSFAGRALAAAASAASVVALGGCFSVVDLGDYTKAAPRNSTSGFGTVPYSDLRATFASMTPHGGHMFEFRVVDANNFIQSRGVVKGLSSGDTSILVPRAIPSQNGPYRLDFYADVNASGGFDGLGSVISNDHAWRIDPLEDYPEGGFTPLEGVVQVAFLHNTSFTNIDQYPSGTPNPAKDTELPVQLRFEGLSAHVGKRVQASVADKATGHVVCLYRVEAFAEDALDAVVPGCVDVGTDYRVELYVDVNDNDRYEDPSVSGGDLGYRFDLTSSEVGLRGTFDVSDESKGKFNVGSPL